MLELRLILCSIVNTNYFIIRSSNIRKGMTISMMYLYVSQNLLSVVNKPIQTNSNAHSLDIFESTVGQTCLVRSFRVSISFIAFYLVGIWVHLDLFVFQWLSNHFHIKLGIWRSYIELGYTCHFEVFD